MEKEFKDEIFNVYVEKKPSKQKKDKFYHVMYIKFADYDEIITFDLDTIGKLADMTKRQILALEVGKARKVGSYILG